MRDEHPVGVWHNHRMSRREFLRRFGIAASAITMSPFFASCMGNALTHTNAEKVFLVKNGDHVQNVTKVLELIGGVGSVVGRHDIVVLKCNGQWPNRGYTHTGCIKAVVDAILAIPGFDGEVHICDNVQFNRGGGVFGFDAAPANRMDNWPDHNWDSLAAEYQEAGNPVATKRWINTTSDISGPADLTDGWMRTFFGLHGIPTYMSYPVYESPLSSGRMIDMKRGVWEDGAYSTTRRLKVIFMPTLNYHSAYAGITSATKSFFGTTEIHDGPYGQFRGHYNVHSSTYDHPGNSVNTNAFRAGGHTARFMNTQYAPDLFITCAMFTGHRGRWSSAVETNTVIAATTPTSLDYVACKNVVAPHAGNLDPDLEGPVRSQLLGCVDGGIGTIEPTRIELVQYDFLNPSVTRIDVEHAIRGYLRGDVRGAQVRDVIGAYLEQ